MNNSVNIEHLISTAKRKRAVCRLKLTQDAKQIVNHRSIIDYFHNGNVVYHTNDLLQGSGIENLGFRCTVQGGGLSAQLGAIRHAIGRALLARYSATLPAEELAIEKKKLRVKKVLTTDSRQVEGKKAGLAKARKARMRSKR